jgi:hypothetical protein
LFSTTRTSTNNRNLGVHYHHPPSAALGTFYTKDLSNTQIAALGVDGGVQLHQLLEIDFGSGINAIAGVTLLDNGERGAVCCCCAWSGGRWRLGLLRGADGDVFWAERA